MPINLRPSLKTTISFSKQCKKNHCYARSAISVYDNLLSILSIRPVDVVKKGPLEISIFKRNQVCVEKFTKNKKRRDKTKKEVSWFLFRAGTFVSDVM